MSVPIAILEFGLLVVEPDLIPDTMLCLPPKREPLVPKVHTFFEKVVHTPSVSISLVFIWDLSVRHF